MITYRAALINYRKEKIRYFANLLINGANEDIDIDCYEEYLKIVEELSAREIRILILIDEYYKEYSKGTKEINPLSKSLGDKVWTTDDNPPDKEYEDKFISFKEDLFCKLREEYNLTDDEIKGFLIRLSRSGLYEQFDFITGPDGSGKLTVLYYKVKQLILQMDN